MRSFAIVLLALWGACFISPLLLIPSGTLQPLDGDLTRIGGLSERDYGWNAPQVRFEPLVTRHFTSLDTMARSGRAYDMLVIGDSFSEAGVDNEHAFGFQEWIQASLRISVATIPNAAIDYSNLVCDLAKLSSPPRFLVFETVERYLSARIRQVAEMSSGRHACVRASDRGGEPAPLSPAKLVPFVRITTPSFGARYAVFYTQVEARLAQWLGSRRDSVRSFRLAHRGLFSSRLDHNLLVVSEDAEPRPVDAVDVRAIVVEAAQQLARACGTKLVLLVSPNKLSAYWRYLVGNAPGPTIPSLRAAGVPMADADIEIARLIAQGYPDVYLPNDTHWGYRGHCAAAHAIAEYIALPWRFRRCDS